MRLLLRGADLIDTEPAPVLLAETDLLIEDGRIAAVGTAAAAPGDAQVLDLRGMQVVPGFVDTHRHTWQNALRAAAVDAVLSEYVDIVRRGFALRMRAADVHVATLAGARQCLDSGITTLQDFADIQHTPEHTEASLSALRTSGIRAVFGYGDSVFGTTRRDPAAVRAARAAIGGPITLALAALGPSYSDLSMVDADWRLAAELDARIVTHVGRGPVAKRPIEALRDKGLLHERITFVHANSLPDDELAMIADAGAAVSIAPAVEAQMGHGAPMAGRLRAAGVPTGLGVDVVTTAAPDMFTLMRAAVLTSQLGEGPRLRAADALRLATIEGARALGMAGEIGSLRPGKHADLIVLRPDPVAARHDPIGALVALGSPAQVESVFVGGVPVKSGGTVLGADPITELVRSAEYLLAG